MIILFLPFLSSHPFLIPFFLPIKLKASLFFFVIVTHTHTPKYMNNLLSSHRILGLTTWNWATNQGAHPWK